MYTLRILNHHQTNDLLSMEQAVDDVELSFRLFAQGKAGVFPVIVHQFEQGVREMDLKSGHLAGAGIFGMKMLGFCSENIDKGEPPLSGLIAIMNVEKQQPIGILDGTPITFMRTGAAGAVAAKTFSRQNSKKALIIGAGNQGRAQLMGLAVAMPQLEQVTIVDRADQRAASFAEEMDKTILHMAVKAAKFHELPLEASQADLIVTCTRASTFFLKKEWIKPGTHINAIGTDMPGKQEIEPSLLASVSVFGDSRIQVVQKGESQYAYSTGLIKEDDIVEIGEVLEGLREGRKTEQEITLFDATGMAIQDLIVASKLLEIANQKGIGTEVKF